MIKEIAGFFSLSVRACDSLTFVGWYFDDRSDLKQLNYTIPGILVFAHSDLNESTTASNAIRCLSVFETDNVNNFLNTPDPENLPTEANLILVRQQDNVMERERERENEYNKIKVGL